MHRGPRAALAEGEILDGLVIARHQTAPHANRYALALEGPAASRFLPACAIPADCVKISDGVVMCETGELWSSLDR